MNLPAVEAVADEFARVLRTWLSDAEWADMCARNASETDSYICHSHDFCDANMAMMEAMENLGVDVQSTMDGSDTGLGGKWDVSPITVLWNDAWNMAKAKHLGGSK
jgi:hypothetical protein